jgi:hypothetical protein
MNNSDDDKSPTPEEDATQENDEQSLKKKEIGGPKGLEPTRYGDWERNGRAYDF